MTRRLSTSHFVSTLAIATGMLAGQMAGAQGFQGTGIVLPGFGDVVISESPDTTNILVNSATAVIDWTPDDNAINNGVPITFLDSNGTANFQGFSDFVVLNRLQVADNSRQILLNGAINSSIGRSVGGKIFFYSPSGFLVGSSAAINVGSLVLSASPIAVDVNGGFMTGTTVTFGQAPNSAAAIATAAGSQINAYGSGSYVALVAPQITHSGIIRTDTAAALVAAEAATITFSPDGLFNIQVTTGTDAATGIDVDGGTITRNSAIEGGGNHRAYLVAVARNDAVTMLVRNGGSVGFDTATSAAVEDNVVVLSGGYDVNGTPNIPSGTSSVNLTIDNATFSSDTFAVVSGGATITTSTGSTAFGNNLDLYAGDDSFIQAINGNTLSVGGTLNVNVDRFGANPVGNFLRLAAYGGSTLTVGGDVNLSANASGLSAQGDGLNGDNATGGTVIVQTGSNSIIGIGGALNMSADGYGGSNFFLGGAAGNGTGGIAQILANGGTSSITVAGATAVSAQGFGGSSGECSSCSITGGNGTGGTILLQAAVGSGNQLNFDSVVTLNAIGFGGAGDVVGGIGTGGIIQFQSNDAGAIDIVGNLIADASGQGGFGINNGITGGTGGAAIGGNVSTLFNGAPSTIALGTQSNFAATAFGGSGLNGGNATGGWVNLQARSAGTLTADFLGASANAIGGSGNIGGTATGGRAWVQAITGASISINDLSLNADGLAGQSTSGNGATGTGGYVIASATNAALTINNVLDLEANGRGGFAGADNTTGGIGQGGQADVFADNGGTVTLGGSVALDANGQGGNYINDLATGGNGTGGLVYFQASNGATLSAASNVVLNANGYGGFSFGDCNFCGGTGGNGTGGQVVVQAFGAGGTALDVGGVLSLSASGFGSYGYAGRGGNGLGGTARVFIADASLLDLASDLIVTADGQGGGQDNGGLAGNGTGGLADVATGTGANAVTITGVATVSASGFGGNASGSGSIGGNGRGGFARILSQGGLANFLSDVEVRANGSGGTGVGGDGGNGTAGQARLVANGGDIGVAADLAINAISTGGDGNFGGNAITFIGNDPQNTSTSDARLLATNGDVVVTGATLLDASAHGGNAANGGTGGNASAGFATVHARNSNLGPASLTLGNVTVTANGTGGSGGAGVFGDPGGNGGNGGSGTGGFIVITASAGNGTLDLGDVIASASAFGGDGGGGGSSEILAGGNGGSGGSAEGGFLNIGTESGLAQATGANDGSATFASITALATAVGGDGGGISFGNPLGLVGDGGDAHGGQSFLLVRGSPVTVGAVLLDATATGGDGGFDQFENFSGTGGTATAGQVGVVAGARFNLSLQRGSLTAGNIVGIADAFGGNGTAAGLAGSSGGLLFSILDSDATIASVSLTSNADFFDPTSPIAGPSRIAVRGANVDITGGFTVTTPGAISMWADSATLDAATITVGADNFIRDPVLPAPTLPGTYTAGTIALTTAQDLIVDAHLSSPNSIFLTAPALVQMLNVTSGGSVLGNAGTDFAAANVTAADGIDILAGGNIALGVLSAGIGVGLSTDAIFLDAIGSISLGNATALGSIDFTAGTTVTGGNLTSGLGIGGEANGAIILGNLSAGLVNPQGPTDDGFSIGIASATSINVGNAAGAEAVGFATLGALTTGNIIAGTDVLALASGNMSFGSITAGLGGRTYLADASMFIAAGGVDNFDPTLVFGANPVPTLGSITINGPVSTGSFQAAAGTTFGSGAITAGSTIFIRSGGSTTTGNLGAGTIVDIASSGGAITTGSITATSGILLNALTGITTGAMTTGNFIDARSGGSILTGNLITTSGDIYLLSDANITTGTVTAATDAEYDALGNVVLGTANVGNYLFVDAGGNVAMANATAGETIDLLAGGTLTGGNLTAGDSVFALSNGALTLGNVSAGIVNPSAEPLDNQVAIVGSNTSVQVGNVQAVNFVGVASGGAATTGALQSGGDVMALVNGPATIASFANPNGRAYIAGFGMLAVGGGVDNFDPALVYAAANPIVSTGSVTISGATNTGRLDAFVGGNFTTGPITATAINARVGGLATLNGLWQSADVDLWSNDIDIAATGGIDGGTTGTITLVSTNATQALIGDGLTGTGYALSNAEFGRLSSGNLVVAARGDASAAIDMLIGNLNITGPLAGSTIESPTGSVVFATGNPVTQIAGGVIRVTGNVAATGFQPTNVLEFVTGQFELDADAGSVLVEQSAGVLGGILDITANRIHVASGAVLQRLTDNPLYDGREDDLAAPIAVARPDGVIAADTIYVSPIAGVLVQNTGTSALRAGFRARYAELFPPEGAAPGSIELIVNGQLVTEGGTLTGVDVRDALVDILDIAVYTDNSSINGCPLTGSCSGSIFPPGFTPTPGIQHEITLITRNLLPPPDFGNEDFIDDNDDATEDGATSPIQPPQPLFDTSALGDQGDIDDPVSGSGNPALMETPPPTGNKEQQP